MKIKGSNKTFCPEQILTLFGIGAVICAVFRLILVSGFIDAETGFYINDSFLITVFNILVFGFAIAILVLSFLSSHTQSIDYLSWKSKSFGILTGLYALSFFYDCFYSFTLCVGSVSEVSLSVGSAFKAMMISGTIPTFFRFVFAFFSGIYFLIFAKGLISGNSKLFKHKLLAISPVAWAGFRLLCLFVKQISFIRVSDLFFELIMLSCMIMFFMAFAQVSSGVYSEGFVWRIVGFGCVSSLIALTLNISRFAFTFIGSGEKLNSEYPLSVSDFVYSLFIIGFLLQGIRERKSSEN